MFYIVTVTRGRDNRSLLVESARDAWETIVEANMVNFTVEKITDQNGQTVTVDELRERVDSYYLDIMS